jgi:hypothetical protein
MKVIFFGFPSIRVTAGGDGYNVAHVLNLNDDQVLFNAPFMVSESDPSSTAVNCAAAINASACFFPTRAVSVGDSVVVAVAVEDNYVLSNATLTDGPTNTNAIVNPTAIPYTPAPPFPPRPDTATLLGYMVAGAALRAVM